MPTKRRAKRVRQKRRRWSAAQVKSAWRLRLKQVRAEDARVRNAGRCVCESSSPEIDQTVADDFKRDGGTVVWWFDDEIVPKRALQPHGGKCCGLPLFKHMGEHMNPNCPHSELLRTTGNLPRRVRLHDGSYKMLPARALRGRTSGPSYIGGEGASLARTGWSTPGDAGRTKPPDPDQGIVGSNRRLTDRRPPNPAGRPA